MNNFGSYYGEQVFDFETDTGRNGYAIFGEIGRGKTTLVDSVLWGLYGHVEVTKESEGKILKKNRPLIDAEQMSGEYTKKWYLPLLNFEAWGDSNYNCSVRLEFEHQGRNYSLLREVIPGLNVKPRIDRDVKFQVHLGVDGKTVDAALISSTIGEIIPERIAKFFFVEVDSIKSYSTLLDSDGSVGGIVEDVEAILGMPALDHSKSDFTSLSLVNSRALEKLRTSDARNLQITKVLKEMDEEKEVRTDELKGYIRRLDTIGSSVTAIELELSEHTSTETHMKRLSSAKAAKTDIEEKMAGYYSKRQSILSGGAWKFLLQSKIQNIEERLEEKSTTKIALEREISGLTVRKDHLTTEVHEGGAECESCGFVSEGITQEEIKNKTGEVIQLEQKILEITEQSEALGTPLQDTVELSKFRDSGSFDSMQTLETQIAHAELDINEQVNLINEINISLRDHDVFAIQRLQADKIKLIEERGDIRGAKKSLEAWLHELKDTRAKRASELKVDSKESPQSKIYSKSVQIFNWLENTFESALTEFKNDARISVEKHATLAWKFMIPEPGKYKEIKINQSWNTEVISSTGKSLPIANPGHRQTLAVCLFDGLRKTSGRRFPTFFDNPGSNIGEYTLDKMAAHFWNDAEDQIVMLSHGGGLKQNKTMKEYGTKLARAWMLSYAKGDKTTTEIEVIS